MRIINKYILKELIPPFFLSVFILVFVLLTQFMVKHLDRFLGKGISFTTILKFILYNSASILSLAIPMAILVATMMAFGRLSSDNEITGFKSNGISYYNFLKPGLFFGIIVVVLMIPFNLWILPDMNHSMRKLTYQISKDRPDIDIRENMINTIYDKVIYVGDKINNDSYSDIVIFNKNNYKNRTTILAESGQINSLEDGIVLDLKEGSIHEDIKSNNNEYRKTYFDQYNILIPFDNINFNKDKVLIKQDREMDINTLLLIIDKKNHEKNKLYTNNITNEIKINELEIEKVELKLNLGNIEKKKGKDNQEYKTTFIKLSQLRTSIDNLNNSITKNKKIIPHFESEINNYEVELHKKFAIPFACIIFILLGIPLGIVSKKGSFSISIAISLGFFILYWALLTVGEFMGDEGKINPALSMWLGNIFIGTIALILFYISSIENTNFGKKIVSLRNLLTKPRI